MMGIVRIGKLTIGFCLACFLAPVFTYIAPYLGSPPCPRCNNTLANPSLTFSFSGFYQYPPIKSLRPCASAGFIILAAQFNHRLVFSPP
ncbi:hypothetical protein BD779DRAFT_62000 [Infundibulicybe gibba]|nr:hypothetical protein BD779DRAFT_62000 [Infundibulicybe gibba]